MTVRIASLQPSITLTLAALDRLDLLCAGTRYCLEALPSLAELGLPVLSDSWSFQKPEALEALRATKPDVVMASVPYRMESLAAILKAGFPLLALAPGCLADISTDIELIGRLAGADAEPVLAVMRNEIAGVQARTEPGNGARPVVYCEEWGKPL